MSISHNDGWIEFQELEYVSLEYRDAFQKARNKLNAILVREPYQPVDLSGVSIKGVLIEASTGNIDGPAGVLGKAGPTHIRTGNGLPLKGVMQFDNHDLHRLREKGELEDVILHEMFHVLGAGTLWIHKNLLVGGDTNDPVFVGINAVSEYQILVGHGGEKSVPVANTGGPGTKNGHWREETFGTELNTGFLNGIHRPLSRMSIAALADIGYAAPVMEEADPYMLPVAGELPSLMSLEQCCSRVLRPEFHVVNG